MLPAADAAFLARGALRLQGTVRARGGPVTADHPSSFLPREVVAQALVGRADIDVVCGEVAKVLITEPALRLGPGGQRLWQGDGDPGPITSQDLMTVEVAAIGDDSQFIDL